MDQYLHCKLVEIRERIRVVENVRELESELNKCADQVVELYDDPHTSGRVCEELLVLVAEIAKSINCFSLAQRMVDEYLMNFGDKNEFYCRILLVKGLILCNSNSTSAASLSEMNASKINAAKVFVEILQIVKSKPIYEYLAYNASLGIWIAIRNFLRDGQRQNVLEYLAEACTVMDQVSKADPELLGSLHMAMAMALEEKQNTADAQKHVQQTIQCLEKVTDSDVSLSLEQAKRYTVHLGQQKSVAAAKSSSDSSQMIQCIRSGLLNGEDSKKEIKKIYESIAASEDVANISSVGVLAVQYNMFDTVREMLTFLNPRTKLLSPRDLLYLQIIRAAWLALDDTSSVELAQGSEIRNNKRKSMTKTEKRIESIRILEQVLVNINRMPDDAYLIEDCCTVVWNVAQPLFQPSTRKYIHKVFTLASEALERVESLQYSLRSLLHAEVAKCDVDAEFVSRASDQVELALMFDQGANGNLDSMLQSMKDTIQLKANPFKEADSKYEQALMLVEQAKDASAPNAKFQLLQNATQSIRGHFEKSEASGATQTNTADQQCLRLLGAISKMLWQLRRVVETNETSEYFFEIVKSRDLGGAQELQIMIAEMHLIRTEIYAEKARLCKVDSRVKAIAGLRVNALGLKTPSVTNEKSDKENLSYGQIFERGTKLYWSSREKQPFDERLADWKERVISHLDQALHIATEAQEKWLAENVGVYLWNYHMHLFNGSPLRHVLAMDSLLLAFEKMFKLLKDDTSMQQDTELFCRICQSYASLCESSSDKYQQGIEACRAGIAAGDVIMNKYLYQTLHRLCRLAKVNEKLPDDSIAAAYAVIQLLQLSDTFVGSEEKKTLLQQVLVSLGTPFEHPAYIEVTSRLAVYALDIGATETARQLASLCLEALARNGSTKAQAITVSDARYLSVSGCILGMLKGKAVPNLFEEPEVASNVAEDAFSFFGRAMQYAEKARHAKVVMDIAREAVNLYSVMRQGKIRSTIKVVETMDVILKHICPLKDTDVALKRALCMGMLEGYKELEEWKRGFDAANRFFSILPVEYHRAIWAMWVIFANGQGIDLNTALKNTKNISSDENMAWLAHARHASTVETQMHAYVTALSMLRNSNSDKFPVLMEFAEWLHANRFKAKQIEQCFLEAMDLLIGSGGVSDLSTPDDIVNMIMLSSMMARAANCSKVRLDMALVAIHQIEEILKASLQAEHLDLVALSNAVQSSVEIDLDTESMGLLVHHLFELSEILVEYAQEEFALYPLYLIPLVHTNQASNEPCTLALLKRFKILLRLGRGDLVEPYLLDNHRFDLNEDFRYQAGIEPRIILHDPKHEADIWRSPSDVCNSTDDGFNSVRIHVGPREPRQYWILIAQELIDFGYIYQAKVYVQEATLHNEAYLDWENEIDACICMTRIGMLEGKDDLMQYLLRCLKCIPKAGGATLAQWKSITHTATNLLQSGENLEDLITRAFNAVDSKRKLLPAGYQDLDLESLSSEIEALLANTRLKRLTQKATSGDPCDTKAIMDCAAIHKRASLRVRVASNENCTPRSVILMTLATAKMLGFIRAFVSADSVMQQSLYLEATQLLVTTQDMLERLQEYLNPTKDLYTLSYDFGQIQIAGARIELQKVANTQNTLTTSTTVASNVVEKWLDDTKPVPELSEGERLPNESAMAHSYASNALYHVGSVPGLGLEASLLAAKATGSREQLVECVARAIAEENKKIAHDAASYITRLDCTGTPSSSTLNYLILAQSCGVSDYLLDLARQQLKPSDRYSMLSSLQENVESCVHNPKEITNPSWPYNKVRKALDQFPAKRRISWTTSVDALFKNIPSTSKFLIVSVSPEKDMLYSCIFSKSTIKRSKISFTHLRKATWERIEELKKRFRDVRLDMNRYVRQNGKDLYAEDEMDTKLNEILSEMQAVFRSALPRELFTESYTESLSTVDLIMLVDPLLAELPMESFVKVVFRSVSRDFSMHVHLERIRCMVDSLIDKDTDSSEPVFKKSAAKYRYLIDPNKQNEDVSTNLEEIKPKTWVSGHDGWVDGEANQTDIENFFLDREPSNVFAIGGVEFLSLVPKSMIPGGNLSSIENMVVLDRFDTITSQQGSGNEIAAMISLAGVQSVVTNLWKTSPSGSIFTAQSLIGDDQVLLSERLSNYRAKKNESGSLLRPWIRFNTVMYGLPNL